MNVCMAVFSRGEGSHVEQLQPLKPCWYGGCVFSLQRMARLKVVVFSRGVLEVCWFAGNPVRSLSFSSKSLNLKLIC